MEQLKYITPILDEIYLSKTIKYNGIRLKTINLIFIIDTFLTRYIIFRKDNIKLNSQILKSLYGGTYKKYIEYLIEKDFIYLYKNYSSGLRANCYKLTDKAKRSEKLTLQVDTPIRLYNKYTQINNSFSTKIDDNVKNKLQNDLYLIDLDYCGAKKWINNNIDKDIDDQAYLTNMANCTKISIKDLYYVFDKYGRFHTNFTTLKKQIREQFLTFSGQPIKELDIVNSQPFFLYLLMKEKGFTNFNGFDLDVLNGVIYDKIKNITGETRKATKINVYSVLFGRVITKNKENLFNDLYPDVYNWICEYKKENKSYKIIAQNLQSIESEFMFKSVIPKIMEFNINIPLITIHDSVIIPEQYYNDVKIIFDNCIQEIINKVEVVL